MSINIEIVTGVILNDRELHFSADGIYNVFKVDNEKKITFRTSLKLLSERLFKYYGLDNRVIHHVFIFNKENYKKITQYFDIRQSINVDELFDNFNRDGMDPKYFIETI